MLLATVLTRKARDESARKKEARKSVLSVAPGDEVKKSFEEQTQRIVDSGAAAETTGVMKYEHPDDIGVEGPGDEKKNMRDPEKPPIQDTQRPLQMGLSSPVQSEVASPTEQTLMTTHTRDSSYMNETDRPPSYMSRAPSAATTTRSPGRASQDQASTAPLRETRSTSSRSTNSVGTHAVRVKTRGSQLSSGFDYHPSLFEMKVHPEKWAAFTDQVVHTTKVDPSDNRKAWAAATGVALSGALVTSFYLKKTMDRTYQEKRIKAGISDMSDGGLGRMLQRWNDEYFNPQGVFVHLELSESAMKNEEQKSKTFRKPSLLYSRREDRERKEEERKYVIVVTKLDADGAPTEAMREMELNEQESGQQRGAPPAEAIAEMPGDTHQGFLIAELPGEDGLGMAELPGGVSLGFSSEKAMQPPQGFAELEPDGVTRLTTEQAVPQEMGDSSRVADEKAAFNKETT